MNTRWVCALLLVGLGCSKAKSDAVGREAAARAQVHVREGLEAVGRLSNGLRGVLEECAPQLAPTLAEPLDVARVRNRLRDLHDDRSATGRHLSLYPTRFVAVVGLNGRGLAGDIVAGSDFVPGLELGSPFPCVGAALAGTAGSCTGGFVAMERAPRREYLVSAVPLRVTPDGPVVGAVVGAMTYAKVARAVREMLDVNTLRDRVQLAVGIWHDGRFIPSRSDPGSLDDVEEKWLVPLALAQQFPANGAQRLAGGASFPFTFSENRGERQWGAAAGPSPLLAPGDGLVVYRSPLLQ